MFTQYWGRGFGVAPATVVLLLAILLMNACGVRVRFRLTIVMEICLTVIDLWELGVGLQMDEDPADSPRMFLHDCNQSWGQVAFMEHGGKLAYLRSWSKASP